MLELLSGYGLNSAEVEKSIEENKHDNLTATYDFSGYDSYFNSYYLLLQKHTRENKPQIKEQAPLTKLTETDGTSSPGSGYTRRSKERLAFTRVENLTATEDEKRY